MEAVKAMIWWYAHDPERKDPRWGARCLACGCAMPTDHEHGRDTLLPEPARGLVLPDHAEPTIEDGYLVTQVRAWCVEALDLTTLVVWRWTMHDDGIRVEHTRSTPRDPGDSPGTEFVTEAISAYPPPPAIAGWLRYRREVG